MYTYIKILIYYFVYIIKYRCLRVFVILYIDIYNLIYKYIFNYM